MHLGAGGVQTTARPGARLGARLPLVRHVRFADVGVRER
jgi:hypothetical protein